MLNIAIGFVVLVVVWFLLRSMGGHGSTIVFYIPPASDPKRKRIIVNYLLIWMLVMGDILFMIFDSGQSQSQEFNELGLFAVFMLPGPLLFLALRRRKK